ncbi:type I-E CRISPR-associated protein Cse1/CasA [Malikia sp.]|uniref:type I-E CRISPR-associated protein Cse1/CasA n=1 Tax=Malikia sp. TaxID=2070706 RepID=UPI0026358C6E|nr:type I-E CRISPR-associated protein Cse1/CasA [Malikia sp.]MDD2728064.1 type I-E CRISPR-associated protein Cse1/CasA [Malikia sp.]
MTQAELLHGNLLRERLLHYRTVVAGDTVAANLPELFAAMNRDEVRDFPALRPHQRHPWHAFLVQLAAIALHQAERDEPFETAAEWDTALMALTPDDLDGAAWCLVSPPGRPAFMQPPVPGGSLADWKSPMTAADELDMLITSKNHDLKAARMIRSSPEDWCHALISLQTQEGFLGAGNYGVSRMNGGFASRCAVGVKPPGRWGQRWRRDVAALIAARQEVVELYGLKPEGGTALTWLRPWDGLDSLAFPSLDPCYIEVCRRIRMTVSAGQLQAQATSTKAPRIAAKELCGVTGDPWMPVDMVSAKALTITSRGFDYKLASELLFGQKLGKPVAQILRPDDASAGLVLLAQGVTRGQGKTEGYHERRIPISKKMRQAFAIRDTDALAKVADARIAVIAEVRKMIWVALTVLFANAARDEAGKDRDASDTVKNRASKFAQPFESLCDSLFFEELTEEIESDAPLAVREAWLVGIADRADRTVRAAFSAGPRSGQLRYRAQSAALAKLHAAMRSPKSKFPDLVAALKSRQSDITEENHEPA